MNLKDNECLLIENREQYSKVYKYMRSAQKYNSLDEWEDAYYKLTYPFYLVWSNSVTRGKALCRSMDNINIWTNEELRIVKFDELNTY